jgi:hypothetical protein
MHAYQPLIDIELSWVDMNLIELPPVPILIESMTAEW